MKGVFFSLFFAYFSFSQAQITGDLIVWYPFSGNATDNSGNQHNGQVFGPVLVEDRFGNSNEAYRFDGDDDFISVPDKPSLWLSNQDFSIALWVKFISSPESDSLTAALISKRLSYDWEDGYLFQRIGFDNPGLPIPGKINFVVSGGGSPYVNSLSKVEAGDWHHLAVTYSVDFQIGQLYIDGSLEDEGLVYSPESSDGADLFFGKDDLTGHFYFNGILDDIRIYGKKLTLEEIQEVIEYNPVSSVWEKSPPLCPVNVFPNPGESGIFSIELFGCEINAVRVTGPDGALLWKGPFSDKLDLTAFPRGIVFVEFFDQAGRRLDIKRVVLPGK